jgi:glycerate 2-kinase
MELTRFMGNTNLSSDTLSPLPLYWDALKKNMPGQMLKKSMSIDDNLLCIDDNKINIEGKINILAYGKASKLMYETAKEIIGLENFGRGLLITHEQITKVSPNPSSETFLMSSHPFISQLSMAAGKAAMEFVQSSNKLDILLVLVSGGGSAMVAMPIPEIDLSEKINFITDVMHASVPEREVNIIKKALSNIKGGKLAESSNAKVIVNCILSDERNHQISAISSGMTVCNELINPLDIMDQYALWEIANSNIKKALRNYGEQKNIGCNKKIFNSVIGSREDLIDGISKLASDHGFNSVKVVDTLHSCSPENAASTLISEYKNYYECTEKGKHLVVSTGEIQVKVDTSKSIKGGRNQHLAAILMLNFCPSYNFFFSAIATDGMDYLDGVHGAFYNSEMKNSINENNKFISSYINDSNTYEVHKMIGSLIEGPKTGTNMSDFFIFSFHKT